MVWVCPNRLKKIIRYSIRIETILSKHAITTCALHARAPKQGLPEHKADPIFCFVLNCFRSVPEIKQKQKMEEKIMNEKFEEPTLEQLRALLSGHPELLHHIKSENDLARADRKKLMELMELCGLSIDQVDHSDPFGFLHSLKNNPGKRTGADKTDPSGFLQGDKNDPTYGQDDYYVPFEITVEALGHKKRFTAFFEYKADGYIKRNKKDDGWYMDEFTCQNTIKILSYTDTPDPGYKTGRPSSSPMYKIQPVLLDNPTINDLFPEKAHDEITDQIEDELLGQIVSGLNSPEDQAAEPDTD
jgi:hypothetical protein